MRSGEKKDRKEAGSPARSKYEAYPECEAIITFLKARIGEGRKRNYQVEKGTILPCSWVRRGAQDVKESSSAKKKTMLREGEMAPDHYREKSSN